MNRREFLAASGAAGVAPLSGLCQAAEAAQGEREYYELQQYQIETEAQKEAFDAHMKEAAIPAPGRVLQLRIYESPSVKTGQKKIEMFNDAGEIAIPEYGDKVILCGVTNLLLKSAEYSQI